MSLWFESALLPEGWRNDVRIELADGLIAAVTTGVPQEPGDDDETEMRQMVASEAIIGLCPITEANLGDDLFPARAFQARAGASASDRIPTCGSMQARNCACSNTASA